MIACLSFRRLYPLRIIEIKRLPERYWLPWSQNCALAVQRIDVVPEDLQRLGVGCLGRIEDHPHRLRVTRAAAGDFPGTVQDRFFDAAGIAGDDRGDAQLALESRLKAPEAAAGKQRFAALGRLGDRALPSSAAKSATFDTVRMIIILAPAMSSGSSVPALLRIRAARSPVACLFSRSYFVLVATFDADCHRNPPTRWMRTARSGYAGDGNHSLRHPQPGSFSCLATIQPGENSSRPQRPQSQRA